MFIPDFLPRLKAGYVRNPADGGCVMQVTSYLFDGGWTDKPACTDLGLGNIAISINDGVGNDARRGLFAAVPGLTGTAFFEVDPELEDEAVDRLAEWVYATFPHQPVEHEDVCHSDGCLHEDRWNCLYDRIDMAVGAATQLGGAIPALDEYLGHFVGDGVVIAEDADPALIHDMFGPMVAAAFRNRPADWKQRQVELVDWFVAFVHKFREEFGAAEAVEVALEDWHRVADHMATA